MIEIAVLTRNATTDEALDLLARIADSDAKLSVSLSCDGHYGGAIRGLSAVDLILYIASFEAETLDLGTVLYSIGVAA